MKKIIIAFAFLATTCFNINAQNVDTTQVTQKKTPSVVKQKTTVEDSFPNPRKALMWSIIPGGGQIYNKKLAWLKLPIVYGALGTGVYFINFTSGEYNRFKLAYSQKVNNERITDPDIPQTVDAARLKQIRDARFREVQEAYILTTVAYLLAGIEAFTAAHLAHFDVKDDLSLHVKPSFEPVPMQGNAVGIGIQIRF
jgi:Family of unknown function (DUF5683)